MIPQVPENMHKKITSKRKINTKRKCFPFFSFQSCLYIHITTRLKQYKDKRKHSCNHGSCFNIRIGITFTLITEETLEYHKVIRLRYRMTKAVVLLQERAEFQGRPINGQLWWFHLFMLKIDCRHYFSETIIICIGHDFLWLCILFYNNIISTIIILQ